MIIKEKISVMISVDLWLNSYEKVKEYQTATREALKKDDQEVQNEER